MKEDFPPQFSIFDIEAGQRAREEGMQKVVDNSAEWQEYARAVLATLAVSGKTFSTDDFHNALKVQPHHPNAVGGVFRWARSHGLIERAGTKESERPSAHARLVWLYRGSEKVLTKSK